MMQENDVAQIMSVTLEYMGKSVEMGIKVVETAGEAAKGTFLAVVKLMNTLYLAKWKGKTNMSRFRAIKGEQMQFMSIGTENPGEIKAIFKELKQHGILYTQLPDLKYGDGKIQFVISPSDMGRMEAFLINHSKGKLSGIKVGPINVDEYVKTGYDEGWKPTRNLRDLEESALEEVQKQTKRYGKATRVKSNKDEAEDKNKKTDIMDIPEGLQGYVQELVPEQGELQRVPLDKSLILQRKENVCEINVPQSEYVAVLKSSHVKSGENCFAAFVDPQQDYDIVHKQTGERSKISGKELADRLRAPTYKQRREQLNNIARNQGKDIQRSRGVRTVPAKTKKAGV